MPKETSINDEVKADKKYGDFLDLMQKAIGDDIQGLRKEIAERKEAQPAIQEPEHQDISVPTPSTMVVISPGAKVVINNVNASTNVAIDMSTHSATHRTSSNRIAVGDSVLESVGKLLGGLLSM